MIFLATNKICVSSVDVINPKKELTSYEIIAFKHLVMVMTLKSTWTIKNKSFGNKDEQWNNGYFMTLKIMMIAYIQIVKT